MSPTKTRETAASRREAWGSLRKLPSGRWQARYPAPDGETYTARTEDDKPLTFLTKTDARAWLASVHAKIARDEWQSPSVLAARRRAEAEAEKARSIGFSEYADRWIALIRSQPNRSGKKRAIGTIRSYKSKVDGYLIPEFGDTPVRRIDEARIRVMTDRLDAIPSPLNPKSKFNGITRPVLVVLMMILRQAAREGIIPAAPNVSIPKQEPVRHDADHDDSEDVASPEQVEALYLATPKQWAIMVLFTAWCQLRRGECLGLQRRDIEWHDDGTATLHVRRQLNANTGDYSSELKSDAGKRSLSIPKIMRDRLEAHLRDNVAYLVGAGVDNPADVAPLLANYRAMEGWHERSNADLMLAILSDQFTIRTRRLLDARDRAGGAPVFAYLCDLNQGSRHGAFHGIEMPLFFRNVGKGSLPLDGESYRASSEVLSRALVAFARAGDPGSDPEGPQWPAYTSAEQRVLRFGDDGVEVVKGPYQQRVDVWRGVTTSSRTDPWGRAFATVGAE